MGGDVGDHRAGDGVASPLRDRPTGSGVRQMPEEEGYGGSGQRRESADDVSCDPGE